MLKSELTISIDQQITVFSHLPGWFGNVGLENPKTIKHQSFEMIDYRHPINVESFLP
jgi:hypothetical protein